MGLPLFLGVALIGGALYVRHKEAVRVAASDQVVTIVSDTNLRAYQETTDTDGDGVRDWLEELRGTDPYTPDEQPALEEEAVSATSSEPYRPPDTITGKFAISFFEDAIRSKGLAAGYVPTPEEVLGDAMSFGMEATSDTFYTRTDMLVAAASDQYAIRQWGNEIGFALGNDPVVVEEPLVTLYRATANEDPKELEKLTVVIDAFAETLDSLLVIAVPPPVAKEHLDLLNTVLATHNSIVALQRAFEDPLYTFIRIQRYEEDLEGLSLALLNIRAVFEQEGIFYTSEEPGMYFFNLEP